MKRALVLLLALSSGCGTLFFHNPQKIRVTSNVPGSLVIAKNEGTLGKMQGLSGEFPLDRSKDHTLLVCAHGNEATTVEVHSHFSWWRILISLGGDILLGLVPAPPILWGVLAIVPDVGSGSWQVLDDDVVVNLKPRTTPEPEDPTATGPSTPPIDPSVERSAAAPGAGERKTCAACGGPIDATAAFCPQCGVRLDAGAMKPCAICGEPRAVGSAVCPHCGLK